MVMMIVLSVIDEKPLANLLLTRPPFLQGQLPQPQDSLRFAPKTQARVFRQQGLRQVREIILAEIGPHSQEAVRA